MASNLNASFPEGWALNPKSNSTTDPKLPVLCRNGIEYHPFMQIAISIALDGVTKLQGGPFGALICKKDTIISVAHNTVILDQDPTCHAECNAIRLACKYLGTSDLSGCDIFTSCEPCPMCWGACVAAHIRTIFIGASAADARNYSFDDSEFYEQLAKPHHKRKIPIWKGLCEQAIMEVLGMTSQSVRNDSSLNKYQDEQTFDEKKEEWEKHMIHALSLLKKAKDDSYLPPKEQLPSACVIIKDGKIISEAVSNIADNFDVTKCAVMKAISMACKALNSFSLDGCIVFSTTEASVMSYAALLWARVSKIFYGISKELLAAEGLSQRSGEYQDIIKPHKQRSVSSVLDVMRSESIEVFQIWSAIEGKKY